MQSQADVDAMPICSEIGGDVYIQNSSDITDLSKFSTVTKIQYRLFIIGNDSLTTLSGFEALTEVAALRIEYNPLLTDVDALSNLGTVNGAYWSTGSSVFIKGNSALTDLDGLSSVTDTQDIYIDGNDSLASINGFSGVTELARSLTVKNNPELLSIEGLRNISVVGDSFDLWNNPKLLSPSGRFALASVGSETAGYPDGFFRLLANPALTSVAFLSNLTAVAGSFRIEDNDGLVALFDTDSLVSIGKHLVVSKNDALPNLSGLQSISSVGGLISISNNDSMSSLDGFPPTITDVNVQLVVSNNDLLENIDALINVQSAPQFDMKYQPLLQNCVGAARLLGWPFGPPDGGVSGSINIGGDSEIFGANGAGCNSVQEILDSTSALLRPSLSTYEESPDGVFLSFQPAPPNALLPVSNFYGVCIGQNSEQAVLPAEVFSFSQTREYTLSIQQFDESLVPASIKIAVDIDHEMPSDVRVTVINPSGTSVLLWDGTATATDGIVGVFPDSLVPAQSMNVLSGEPVVGDWILRITDVGVADETTPAVINSVSVTVSEIIEAVASESPVSLFGFTRERVYECSVEVNTDLGRGAKSNLLSVTLPVEYTVTPSSSLGGSIDPSTPQLIAEGHTVDFSVIPDAGFYLHGVAGSCGGELSGQIFTTAPVTQPCDVSAEYREITTPDTPVIVRTDYEDEEITLFAAVGFDGGAPVQYSAVCTDGTLYYTGQGNSVSVTISGLTNGVAYTCTVTATNSVGTSSASSPTAPITPEETSTGLPIWLLYQATQ